MAITQKHFKQRRAKLAKFLRKLPPEKFNYNQIVTNWDSKRNCGTVCCAAGWCPVLFPKNFIWVHRGVDGGTGQYNLKEDMAKFFGMPEELIRRTFLSRMAYHCDPEHITSAMVADRLSKFS